MVMNRENGNYEQMILLYFEISILHVDNTVLVVGLT